MANPIKVGLVGLGRAGWGMHCGEMGKRTDKFQIVAVCDPLAERRQQAVEKYGCRAYADIAELVQDAEVELVDIASRSPEHVPHALLALKAGKLVFLEKPIALSYKEAMQLKRAKGKDRLYLRHNRRFEAGFCHIREILQSGLIGEPYQIKLRRHGYARRDDWQSIISCGGGQLLNWGPHIVDHALQFLDSKVVELWSDLRCVATVGNAEDHLHLVLRGKNKRVVDMEISGASALSEPVYLVQGTRGALRSDEKTIWLRYLDPKMELSDRKANPGTPPTSGGFGSAEKLPWVEEEIPVRKDISPDCIFDALYASIREGQPFPVTLEQGLEVMRVISWAKQGTKFAGKIDHSI